MLWLLLACGGEEPLEVIVPEELAPTSGTLRYSQETLAGDPSAIIITGELSCEEGTGPWTVRLWSLRRVDRERAPDTLPSGDILTEITIEAPGAFSVYSSRSARLLVVGISADDPPLLAWGDPHGRYTEALQDFQNFSLDCTIKPTPSRDGSLMATQGEVVPADPEPVETGADPQMDRLIAIQAAPRVDVFRRRPSDMGGVETIDRIEDRYRNKLSGEEMKIHMMMLYQLADDPKASDEYVSGVVSSRESSSGKSRNTQVIQ